MIRQIRNKFKTARALSACGFVILNERSLGRLAPSDAASRGSVIQITVRSLLLS
jgi:hypothetical protein